MTAMLGDCRLVLVAPETGRSGLGDYATDLLAGVRPHFGDVVEVRTAGPMTDTVGDIRQYRRAVADAVDERRGRVIVHGELGGAEAGVFWSLAGLRGVPVTATYHDPPQGVWWPAGTKAIANRRLLFHGIHYPLRRISRWVEGGVNGHRTLVALTETGRRAIEVRYPRSNPVYIPHLVRSRPTIKPVQERPPAIGFFGHVYRGKGFEQIERIREELPDDIAIRVAGRGTESLPAVAGVDIVGPVDGSQEDAFFESIRAVVVPYSKRHWYDETYPASGVVAHATAYRTPVVCTDYGSLRELDESVGAVVVRDVGEEDTAVKLAKAISSLLGDDARLTEIGENADRTREERSVARTGEAFVRVWSKLLERQPNNV
jgi:glycosyltransferase involved in cell wall biosynthesis